jgi:hypothetical protein
VHLQTTTSTTTDTKVAMAAVTREIKNTLTQLPAESSIKDEDVIGKYTSRGIEWVRLLYDWASHRLTVCVSYKTPILLSVNDNLFDLFKQILDEFYSDEEERRDSYPEKGRHFF